jgi:hypothetical protein
VVRVVGVGVQPIQHKPVLHPASVLRQNSKMPVKAENKKDGSSSGSECST